MNKTFGEQLRTHREVRGWTRNQLAHRAHCATVTVHKIERDERQPSMQMAQQLADALALTPSQKEQLLATTRPRAASTADDGRAAQPFPAAPAALIVRDAELAQIGELLTSANHRLLTLTGTGGVGKTRLATAAADALATHFADGLYTVELAALRHPHLLLDAVARAVDCPANGALPLLDRLTICLRDQHLLLYLDNLEHLLDEKQRLAELLANCSRLSLLITSREATRLPGETVLTIQPLALPSLKMNGGVVDDEALLTAAEASPAVALFTVRARESQPGFALSMQNVEAVVQLCTRLDGLPLAVELVAARVRLMSPQMLLERFTKSAGQPRIGLLAQPGATLPGSPPTRQRSLHETLDWSYRLLNREEQRAFCRAALFQGGFTLDAAEALLHDEGNEQGAILTWDLLGSLLDKHLLHQRSVDGEAASGAARDGAGEPRFQMLETVHAYAREQLLSLGEVDPLARRHAQHYCALAEALGRQVYKGVDVERWLDAVEVEQANFRAALEWAIAHNEGELAARIAVKLNRFWWIRHYVAEARAWLEKTLAILPPPPPSFSESLSSESPFSDDELLRQRARVLRELGQLCYNVGDFTKSHPYLEEALALAQRVEDERLIALVASSLASLLCGIGELAQAEAYMLQSLEYDLQSGYATDIAITYGMLGEVAMYQEKWAVAEERLRHARRLQEELGDRYSLMITNINLAHAIFEQSRADEALPCLQEGLAYARAIEQPVGEATALRNLAELYVALGQAGRAFDAALQAFAVAQQHGLHQMVGGLIEFVGLQMSERGDWQDAVQLLGAVCAVERAANIELEARDYKTLEQRLLALRKAHGAEEVNRLYRIGGSATTAQAIATAQNFCRALATGEAV